MLRPSEKVDILVYYFPAIALETVKPADLVVLSEDPLAVDPMKIKDIQVLETIKEGQSIY